MKRADLLSSLALLAGLALGGCPEQTVEVRCPPLFEPDADGRCTGIVPAAACPGGTMTLLGETECVPVGPSRCVAGFEAEADGWGCKPILPTTPCTGDTREVLGHTDCRPVALCSGVPAVGATHFVDPNLTQPDATHFLTISAALAAAPEGSVIYVAPGTYRENLVMSRAVTLLGDCPATTILEAPASGPGMGVRFEGARGVTLSHFTVRGFLPGVGATGGTEAFIISTVIEDSIAYGAIAIDPNTRLNINQTVIRNTLAGAGEITGNAVAVNAGGRLEVTTSALVGSVGVAAYVSGTGTLQIDDSVILRTTLDAGTQNDAAVKAHAGGSAWIGNSAIVDNVGIAVVAADPGTRLTVLDSVISDTGSDDTGLSGFGLALLAGATGTIDGLTSTRNRSMSVVVRRSDATFDGLVSRDTLPSVQPWTTLGGDSILPGVGLWIAKGSEVEVRDSAIVRGFGEAIHIDESVVSLERVVISEVPNETGALRDTADLSMMIGSEVTADGLDLRSLNHWALFATDPGTVFRGHRVMIASVEDRTAPITGAAAVGIGATAELSSFFISGYPQVGLMVFENASARLEDSVIRNIRIGGPEDAYGDGLVCILGSILHVRGSEVSGSAHAGFWLEECGGSLIESRIVGNLLGLRAVEGVTVETTDTLPSTVSVGTLIIDEATVFEDNEVRLTTDAIPLPKVPPAGDPPPQ